MDGWSPTIAGKLEAEVDLGYVARVGKAGKDCLIVIRP